MPLKKSRGGVFQATLSYTGRCLRKTMLNIHFKIHNVKLSTGEIVEWDEVEQAFNSSLGGGAGSGRPGQPKL